VSFLCVAGWGSGPRKPLTNPFKESFDLSPFPSTTIDPKEKEVTRSRVNAQPSPAQPLSSQALITPFVPGSRFRFSERWVVRRR
jgi:hypothetical protein